MKTSAIIVFFMLIPCSVWVQEKAEKEFRLKEVQVPDKAIQFINQTGEAGAFKWYKEVGISSSSIEAKGKVEGKRYSVEFDSLGNIEDVEVEINWKELSDSVRNAMCKKLSLDFKKFKLIKIQQQFTGSPEDLIKVIRSRKQETYGLTVQYELVLEGKTEVNITPYEYTFDEQGNFVKRLKIISRNIDNLEY